MAKQPGFRERRCPRCKEVIRVDASRCRHCHADFSAEEMTEAISNTGAKVAKASLVVVGLCVLVGFCALSIVEDPEQAADRPKVTPCLSPWDGLNPRFVEAVKAQLRDPDSFAHDETRVSPVDEKGEYIILMKYRARNGFGGMNVANAMGTVRAKTCEATVTTLDVGAQP